MKIPLFCEAWEKAMQNGDSDARRILENIRAEKCLDGSTEREFFDRVRDAGQPSSDQEARVIASNAVSPGKDPSSKDLFCKGEKVPDDRFLTISRLITAAAVRYLDEEFADQSGLALSSLEHSTPEEIQDIVQAWGTGAGLVGRQGGIAWVTEDDSLTGSALSLANKLGLPHLVDAIQKQGCAVLITFERQRLPNPLHTPRVTDAIDHPPFRPVLNCSAPYGRTQPLDSSSHEEGLPEAIHRSCKIDQIRISFVT